MISSILSQYAVVKTRGLLPRSEVRLDLSMRLLSEKDSEEVYGLILEYLYPLCCSLVCRWSTILVKFCSSELVLMYLLVSPMDIDLPMLGGW